MEGVVESARFACASGGWDLAEIGARPPAPVAGSAVSPEPADAASEAAFALCALTVSLVTTV